MVATRVRFATPHTSRIRERRKGPFPIAHRAPARPSRAHRLLPGEEQDATKLEMGRTYEQLDSGEVTARERGAAPTERELSLAAGVAGGKRQAIKSFFGNIMKR